MFSLIKGVFFCGLILLVSGIYKGDALPSSDKLLPQLADDPIQAVTDRPPFDTTVNKITYHINPLYRYELYGLVVSKHDTHGFMDSAHKEWGDHINTTDLCVIWGRNAFSGIYQQLRFSSGQWTCYVESSDSETWEKFSGEHLSNNHLLADQRDISRKLKQVQVGDQIYFKGYLVEYSHDSFHRGTSIVRTDSGDDACETVYIKSFSILRHNFNYWRALRWISIFMLLISILAWFFMPQKYFFNHKIMSS
ncbi:hypothetical protein FACS189441_8020 [Betaproteobacteria bacterium]|nr:hypothetical protein FACS189441_8020 [Betaproteobacteria bacterium]